MTYPQEFASIHANIEQLLQEQRWLVVDIYRAVKTTFIIWFLWLTEQIKIHSHWGFGPKNDLHLTCPSNLRALPETNGLPARIHASFKRYLVKQYQGPVISLSKKTASQLSYKWPLQGYSWDFPEGRGHCATQTLFTLPT